VPRPAAVADPGTDPGGDRPPPGAVEAAVRTAKATGKGIRKIAGELGIGVGTVQRIVG